MVAPGKSTIGWRTLAVVSLFAGLVLATIPLLLSAIGPSTPNNGTQVWADELAGIVELVAAGFYLPSFVYLYRLRERGKHEPAAFL
jgi:hypothetical protein